MKGKKKRILKAKKKRGCLLIFSARGATIGSELNCFAL